LCDDTCQRRGRRQPRNKNVRFCESRFHIANMSKLSELHTSGMTFRNMTGPFVDEAIPKLNSGFIPAHAMGDIYCSIR